MGQLVGDGPEADGGQMQPFGADGLVEKNDDVGGDDEQGDEREPRRRIIVA